MDGMRLAFPLRKAAGEHWITIHPHGKGAVGKYGDSDYRRVLIDGNGNIVGGSVPKELHGQNVREAWRKSKQPQPHLSRHLTERGVAHTLEHHMNVRGEPVHSYTIGEGVQDAEDKWGRTVAARGTVAITRPTLQPRFGPGLWVHVDSNFEDKDKLKSMGARFDGDRKSWYIPIKDIPDVARAFQHVSIHPDAAVAYEQALSAAPKPPQKQTTQIRVEGKEQPVSFESAYRPAWNGKMPEDMQHMNLYEHQKAGVEFLLHNKKAVLGYAVGLGKCVSADTPIWLSDGRVIPISDFVDPFIGDLEQTETEREVAIDGFFVPSLDVATGDVSWKRVESVFKQRIFDDLFRVRTKRGKEVSLTSDHPLPVVREGAIAWIPCRNVKAGDTLATPQWIQTTRKPNSLSEEHAQLLAWQLGEGYEDAARNVASVTNSDESVLRFVHDTALKITEYVHMRRPKNRCPDVEINGIAYREWLENKGFLYGAKSSERRVPSSVWEASAESVRAFLKALFDAEGTVSQDIQIEFCSASRQLVTDISYLLLRFGVVGQIKSTEKMATNGLRIRRTYWRLFISSEDMRRFREEIGFDNAEKSLRLNRACQKKTNPNINVIPFASRLTKAARDCDISVGSMFGKDIALSVANDQSFGRATLAKISAEAKALFDGTRFAKENEWVEKLNATPHRSGFSRAKAKMDKLFTFTGSESARKLADDAAVLSREHLAWDQISSIEPIPGTHLVYDLRVADNHSFVGGHGGLFLHNTPTAITAANIAMDEGRVKRFAVIAPSSVKFQWQSEIAKFSGRKAVVLDNSTPKRLEQSFEDAKTADFVIANYEMLRNPEYADRIKELAGDAVIADEGHKIKNESQQTKAWRETFKYAKYRWLLTATPFPNGQPRETHTMLSHVAPQKVGSWNDFAHEHAVMQRVSTPNGFIHKPVALKNQAALREKMKDAVMLRHHNSPDVNSNLPSARHVTHSLDMTKDQARTYKAMREDLMHELSGMDDESFRENAANILTKMKRLEQIAVDPDELDPAHADMKKLYPKEEWAVQTTMDHLENPDNRGMVIFSDAKMPLEKVKRGLIAEGLKPSEIGVISGDVTPEKRTEAAKLFGEGKMKVILATSAGEEGVNLQHGGHTMIHMDTPWVPKSITQREGRVLRTGQPSPHTMFYSPTMRGTVEESKRGKLASKVGDIEKLLGEGAAGSAAENVAASAKAWSRQDILEMLGDLPKGKVKKSMGTVRLPAAAHCGVEAMQSMHIVFPMARENKRRSKT